MLLAWIGSCDSEGVILEMSVVEGIDIAQDFVGAIEVLGNEFEILRSISEKFHSSST